MRVISGKARSVNLLCPKGDNTRPTTDKIKETLFNMIQFDLCEANFLDLFSGSGAIGIEALSRGAKFCIFVESNKQAVNCIQENLIKTKLKDESLVIASDIKYALQKISSLYKEQFDIIFMDPPYNKNLEKLALEYLKDASFVSKNTLIIIEMDKKSDTNWIFSLGFEIIKEKVYKSNKHIFVRRI